jgi:hypothetical protein
MKSQMVFRESQVSEKHWFWFLAFMGLILRVPFLNLAKAETTDGVLCLTYFSPDYVVTPRFVLMPAYPALLWLGEQAGLNGGMWGRILASLAGLLFLIPLWKFSRRWLSMEMTALVCVMALFSPLLWQWSLKVMPDTLFLFFSWWCLERLTAVYIDKKTGDWAQACLAGALAAFTRAEGFLLLPWILFLGWKLSRQGQGKNKGIEWALGGLFILLFWTGPLVSIANRFSTILSAYQEGTGLPAGGTQVEYPLLNFIDHFYAYLSQPLYVFTPLVFWFAVLGLAKMVRRKDLVGEAFKTILLPVYFLIFISRLIPTQYQDRHMLPFLPLLLVACGFQLETFVESLGSKQGSLKMMFWRNGLLIACILWLFVFSITALVGLADSFGDVKRSAEFLKTLPPNAVIYSDEVPKTQYWSGRKVRYLQLPFRPNPGDYVIYHSFYTARLGFVDQDLRARHSAVPLHSDESMVVPLLTDVMSDQALQNRIVSTAYRFQPQFFSSLVYQIGK